jgi:hypothetical protein
MFGLIKENILSDLEKIYQDKGEKDFKKSFAKYVKTLKENKTLKEFNEIYDLINTMKFDDENIAKDFVEESIAHLKTLNLDDVNKLKTLTESNKSIEGTITESIDQLVFNNKLSILDKVTHKANLVKHLTRTEKEVPSLQESLDKFNTSIVDKISKLNEEQVKVLNLFAENDESKINTYFQNLVENTQQKVENVINKSDDIMIVKKLLEVRSKINEMSKEKPSLDAIDNLLDLNKSFE